MTARATTRPWWEDPDALLNPLTPEAVTQVLTADLGLQPVRPDPATWVTDIWQVPVRLRLIDDGGFFLFGEALYLPTFEITDPAALATLALTANHRNNYADIRVERTDSGTAVHSMAWMPLLAGATHPQLHLALKVLSGTAAGVLKQFAQWYELPASVPADTPAAAEVVWQAYDAARAVVAGVTTPDASALDQTTPAETTPDEGTRP